MGEWNESLFGCFSNCVACIITYIVPCYAHGKIGEAAGDSFFKCCCFTLIPILNIITVFKLRQKIVTDKGIDESACKTLLLLCFCGVCALNQEYREMGLASASIVRQ